MNETIVTPETSQAEPPASQKRLREILQVLGKHHITRGLTPAKLREILEDLGPTYVKLGQIMSMRSDMLPENYCRELTKLRTEVSPLPYSVVSGVIEEELKEPAGNIFSQIEETPLGSASIAQVHPAVLKDGTKVVIKIQRPAIKEIMQDDILLLKKAAGILKLAIGTEDLIDFRTILDELWKTTREEIDFLQEAANLNLFYENQRDIVYVTCPKVFHEFTTPRLLVMEYIDGIQIDETVRLQELGYDMTEIGQKAAENYCKQILEDGFFHADPHPGNLWVAGGQIAWLDLGMTGRLTEHNKQLLKKAITAILEHDIYSLKNVLLAFGEPQERVNHARLYTDIDDILSKYMSMDFGTMKLGELIERMLSLVKEHRLAITPDITLLGRSMVTMEGTLAACAPDVNILQILSMHMSTLLLKELDIKKLLRHKGRQLYTSMDKSMEIPAQISDLLNITKNGQAQLNLQLSDSEEIRADIHKTADRFILSILAAALFIGSGMIIHVRTIPQWFGIPWISFLGYTISAVIIVGLIVRILLARRK
ncbi:AarF/ABC1/UbiB kinase family protein [Eubacterium sp. am_0171]|uniref:Probable ubiquinone biosynthesis protein UbiB n=1 Tax=Faecalicatena contorta TaxID=39482 RepID=A0A174IN47_9FIRM|nr:MULTISPECIES: AarF/UbiB family protein [Clostridia]MSC84074.1 AarF/ABC1/UbiB kinase family protein [Eubacterium sp. BIOML-A1]MSD06501.1 AarF/ABC1/UbiB kinase family protein [Eubacterium sp. BIOML-A2]RYT19583.1 AarF/ABC1/UbiB kinase family protein [Eubacterium sp. am_0171]CUO88802.1 Probable ubiquinone biosynthesis protein UbiB [[Eubacterium] contortum] [Faecalicatena contorta]